MVKIFWSNTQDAASCCGDGYHIWTITGSSSNNEIPEGIPCNCGAMSSHYENCPTCGERRFRPEGYQPIFCVNIL